MFEYVVQYKKKNNKMKIRYSYIGIVNLLGYSYLDICLQIYMCILM